MHAPRCPRCNAAAPELAPGQPLCDVCWNATPSRVRRAVARLKVSRHAAPAETTVPSVSREVTLQSQWLRAVRQVMNNTEDVGERFPEEARRIHYGEIDPHSIDPAVRILGRLNTQLEYAEVAEIERVGLTDYLRQIRDTAAAAAEALRNAYFLH